MTIRDIAIAFGYEIDKSSEAKVNQSINSLKTKAGKLLGAIGIGFSLKQVNALVEEYGAVNQKLKSATGELANQKELQDGIMQSATNTLTSYKTTANAVSAYISRSKTLLKDQESALRFTELTTKAWKAAGKEESEIASLHSTLAKAFQKNIVDAGTFQTLLAQSPETITYLEKSLGKTRTQLKAMADAGVLRASYLTEAFEKSADKINEAYANAPMKISDALKIAKEKVALVLTQSDEAMQVTKEISKAIIKGADYLEKFLKKTFEWIKKITDRLGGTKNALKLIGVVFTTMKILPLLKGMSEGVKLFSTLLTPAKLKVMAIVAAIVLLYLIIEDVVYFLQGKDSLLGELLGKAGFDVDEVRNKIKDFIDKVKTWISDNKVLVKIEGIVAALGILFMHLRKGPTFIKLFIKAFEGINKIKAFGKTLKNIKSVGDAFKKLGGAFKATKLGGALLGNIKVIAIIVAIMAVIAVIYLLWKNWDKITAWFKKGIDKLKSWFEDLKNKISDKVNSIKESVGNTFQKIVDWFKKNWLALLMFIINPFAGALMLLYNNNEKFREAVDNLLAKIKDAFAEFKQKIKDKVAEWKDGIEEGFENAKQWFENLPARAWKWGKDMLSNFIKGFKSKKGDLDSAVGDVAGEIDDNLGHSVPKKGPLKDDDKWMSDFMQNLYFGLREGMPKLRSIIGDIASELSVFVDENPSPITQNIANGSSSHRIINQYNNWTNNFNGGTKQEQADLAKSSDAQTSVASRKLGAELAYTR